MNNKLTWEEIKHKYQDEWVQLVDYDWDKSEPDPRGGRSSLSF